MPLSIISHHSIWILLGGREKTQINISKLLLSHIMEHTQTKQRKFGFALQSNLAVVILTSNAGYAPAVGGHLLVAGPLLLMQVWFSDSFRKSKVQCELFISLPSYEFANAFCLCNSFCTRKSDKRSKSNKCDKSDKHQRLGNCSDYKKLKTAQLYE